MCLTVSPVVVVWIIDLAECLIGQKHEIGFCCFRCVISGSVYHSTPLVVGGYDLDCIVPWMVSLRKRFDNDHNCGGMLISPTIVLTAAHCLTSGAPRTVDIGRVKRIGDDGSGFETRGVVRAIIHERYNQGYR